MSPTSLFVAQYYELTLRVRFQNGKWVVLVLGPFGLLITAEKSYDSQTEAEQAAVGLARINLHEEKRDVRPVLEAVDWQLA